MSISFNCLNIQFNLKKKNSLKRWFKKAIQEEKKKCGIISYIFTNNTTILELNRIYLSHQHFTDIITFDYSEENTLSGDIYICIDTVLENSKRYKVEFNNELKRVMIHGILHLAGYKDKTKEQKTMMRYKEDFYLKLFD
jgi:probable rRNA maturation factor